MKALIRADASVQIGMGHRVRCEALKQAFESLGWHCQFVIHQDYQGFSASDDLIIEDESEFLDLATNVDLVVIDHYQYLPDMIEQVYRQQAHLLVLDDMNDRGGFPCQWLLNPLHEAYSAKVKQALLGSQYALLRPSFAQAHLQAKATSSHTGKLLITLGGTDPLALTLPIVSRLLEQGVESAKLQVLLGKNASNAEAVIRFCQQHNIAFAQGVKDVTPLMLDASMAISAAGGTLFELACLGVPTVFAQVADNQTRSLEQHVPLAWCDTVRFDNLESQEVPQALQQLVNKVLNYWSCPSWQQAAKACAQQLVDGHGAQRVASLIDQQILAEVQKPA
ncbi:UDP-2,4-diacetamido-2,4,6-trideoxy-beta-L-altropyranose hydrolase [Marinomonas sp.]